MAAIVARVASSVVAVTAPRPGLPTITAAALVASAATAATVIARATAALFASTPRLVAVSLAISLTAALLTTALLIAALLIARLRIAATAALVSVLSPAGLAFSTRGSLVAGPRLLGIARPRSRSFGATGVALGGAAHQRFDLRWAAGLRRRCDGLWLWRHLDTQLARDIAPICGRTRPFFRRRLGSRFVRRRRLSGSGGGRQFWLSGRGDS
jgi:hypothetical protein